MSELNTPANSSALNTLLSRASTAPAPARRRFYINVAFLSMSSILTVRVYEFDTDKEFNFDSAPIDVSEERGKQLARRLQQEMTYPTVDGVKLTGEALSAFDPLTLLVSPSSPWSRLNFAPTTRKIKTREERVAGRSGASGRGLLDSPLPDLSSLVMATSEHSMEDDQH